MIPSNIPVELMELLHKISESINEVRDRLTRIEAQDHVESIRNLRLEFEQERRERIKIQIELAALKTRVAPIVAVIAAVGAGLVSFLFKVL